jgi:polar amino acid transport system substrate-binding protein
MKQLLASLLSLSLLFSGSVFSATSSNSAPNLDKIQDRGTLKVGLSTFVPWAMRDKQGELIGFEVDVAKRLAEDSGLKYLPPLAPKAT